MKNRSGRVFIGLLLGCWLPLVLAAGSWSYEDPHDYTSKYIEDSEWQELKSSLPAYPDEEELMEVDLDTATSRFRFFIDPASISVGEDLVTRYTLVLRSRSGTDNVMYEGMRCGTPQYKTYAYGNSRKREFKVVKKPRWRALTETASTRYRKLLLQYYLCSDGASDLIRTPAEVIRAVKYQQQGEQSYSQ